MILQIGNSDFTVSRHLMIFIGVAICLLSSLPSHPAGAMSAHVGPGDRRNAAAMDKDKIMSSGVEVMEVPASSDDGQLESEEEDTPAEETEGFFAAEKYHSAPKRRLRFQKRYRLRNNKRRLRLHKKNKASAGDDAEYGRPEESAYERDLREPRLRFHSAHDVRKRSSWELGSNSDDEQQPRQRRSTLPIFSTFSKRVPIGNDLQALADILYEEKQNQAYSEFVEYLKKIGRR